VYSDAMLELDDTSAGSWMSLRGGADTSSSRLPTTVCWQDAYPDGGTHPFRGEKVRLRLVGAFGIMWWRVTSSGPKYNEMMSHIDCWATLPRWSA